MHEPIKLPCIFGCVGERDMLPHYLNCPILLGLTSEELLCTFGPSILHRLCIREPSRQSFVMLAAIHGIYHYIKQGNRLLVDRTFSRCGPRMAPIIKLASQKAREYRVQYSRLLFCPAQVDLLEQGGHSFSDGVGSLSSDGPFVRATDPNAHNPLIAPFLPTQAEIPEQGGLSAIGCICGPHVVTQEALVATKGKSAGPIGPAARGTGCAGRGKSAGPIGPAARAGCIVQTPYEAPPERLSSFTESLSAIGGPGTRSSDGLFVRASDPNAHNPLIATSSTDLSLGESFAGPASVSPDAR